MRQLVAAVIVCSIVAVLLALAGTRGAREDDLARSITQMVEKSR